MGKEEYHNYLQSSDWYWKKLEARSEKEYKCFLCFSTPPSVILELHHVTYENIYNEPMEDLRWLCSDCHQKVHKQNVKMIESRKKRGFTPVVRVVGTVFKQISEAFNKAARR